MQLSKRMAAAAFMVTPGNRLADIGTDHAYIPIALLQEKRIPSAIAMDINQGPLRIAQQHISQYGLSNQIEIRRSDGLENLSEGEADSILIAGMGGMLIIKILSEGKITAESAKELILQPQSDQREVRVYLEKEGYAIREEKVIREDGKYYVMMRAEKKSEQELAENQWMDELALRYGPKLSAEKNPVYQECLKREEALLVRVLKTLEQEKSEAAKNRRIQIQEDLAWNKEAQRIQRTGQRE